MSGNCISKSSICFSFSCFYAVKLLFSFWIYYSICFLIFVFPTLCSNASDSGRPSRNRSDGLSHERQSMHKFGSMRGSFTIGDDDDDEMDNQRIAPWVQIWLNIWNLQNWKMNISNFDLEIFKTKMKFQNHNIFYVYKTNGFLSFW